MGKNKNPNRENAIATGDNFYEGRPCIKCGSTRKYVRKSQCVNCKAEYRKKYRKTEQGKKVIEKSNKEWIRKNKSRFRKYMSDYIISKAKRTRLATPLWLTKSELMDIHLFYKNRPDGYHVDHIIPLNGKLVCGLHVPSNLQYLPALENIKKGNRWEPE